MDQGDDPADHQGRRFWRAYLSGAFGLAMGAQVHFLVPLRARELGASFEVIGFIIGAGALASALLSVASGAVIDRLGPRRAFILGSSTTSLLSLLFVLPTSYWPFLFLQPFLGVARNLGWVASQAYITGLEDQAQRPMLTGRFSFFTNIGQMTGPLLAGGAAQLVGFRWALLVPVAYAACFALLGAFLAETSRGARRAKRQPQGMGTRSALEIIAIRGIQVALLLTFVRLWVNLLYTTFLPVHLVDTGFAPAVIGTVMSTSGFVAALVAPTTGFWTRLWSQQVAAVFGLGCGATGLLLVPHLDAAPAIYLIPCLIGIGGGVSLPLLLSIIGGAAPQEKRGVALGLRGMVNQTAATTAPVVVGPLISALGVTLGFTVGGLVAGSVLAASSALHVVSRHRRAS